jgi:DNA-binding NarL/FixJ family response regulator
MTNANASSVGSGKALSAAAAGFTSATGQSQQIRILLADEPSMYRDGLRAVLAAQPDFRVVAEAEDYESILPLAQRHHPDIILFQPLSADSPLAVLRDLQNAELPSRVILLTANENPDIFPQAVRCGVVGILTRKSPTDVLLKSIRKVNAGELWLDRVKTASALRLLTRRPIPPPRGMAHSDAPVDLSRREHEVVALVARGFRNREISEKLFITEQTVKNHMHNIFDKVGAQDRLELALYAIYHRLYE